jgi:hypothetical protein
MKNRQFIIEGLCCDTEKAWPTFMIWKFNFLHLQDDLAFEPVKVSQLNIARRIEEYIFILIVNVATCHII